MKTDDVLNPAFTDDHFVVWLIPGSIALLPWVFVLHHYVSLSRAWRDHEWILGIGFLLAASGLGALVESFGGWIESENYDKRLETAREGHTDEWYEYLVTAIPADLVVHRYVRHRVRLMKFEISVGIASPAALVACWWLRGLDLAFSWPGLVVLTILVGALCRYLFWDAFKIAEILSDIRMRLLTIHRQAGAVPQVPPARNP
jgi:hypothetical protein